MERYERVKIFPHNTLARSTMLSDSTWTSYFACLKASIPRAGHPAKDCMVHRQDTNKCCMTRLIDMSSKVSANSSTVGTEQNLQYLVITAVEILVST